VLYDAAIAACDGLDGARDGVISNVVACNASFNPTTATVDASPGGQPVRCANGADTGDTCLSDVQIASFNVINTPLQLNYALASGERNYPGFNTWGTDFGNPGNDPLQPTVLTLSMGTEQPANPMPAVTATSMPPYGSTFWDQWVKYFVTRNPNFNSLQLDPQNPTIWQNRIVELTGIQDANRTDLSAFQSRGGKILMAHGSHDALVSTRATEQYFNRIRNTMGAAAVTGFAIATFAFLNSGTKRDTGSPRRSFPSSISIRMATPVIGFDIEAMRKMASLRMGVLASTSIRPCASKCATCPLRETIVMAPVIWPASM